MPGDLVFRYVDLGHPALERQLVRLLDRRVDAICVNETETAAIDPRRADAAFDGFCRRQFPLPSSFEVPAVPIGGRVHAAAGPYAA